LSTIKKNKFLFITENMKKQIIDLKVVRNARLNPDHYLLECESPIPLDGVLPGQFAEILVENAPKTFLRRPISVHFVNEKTNTIEFYVKRVGEGTRTLGYLEAGDFVNAILPLGNGFPLEPYGKTLLVGGGCGVAPLLYLAKALYENDEDVDILIGAREQGQISETERYSRYGQLYISTEDGSTGEIGLVTQHSIMKNMASYSKIYVCGPEPMMKAVVNMAKPHNIPVFVSLENTMACGIGACLCCVVNTEKGNVCVCTEGPVFDAKVLTHW